LESLERKVEEKRKRLSRIYLSIRMLITYIEECLQRKETKCLLFTVLFTHNSLRDYSGLPFTVFAVALVTSSKVEHGELY
jgi:hypothetical protein